MSEKERVHCLVVLSFDLEDESDITDVIKEINPPNVPYFNGNLRVVIEPVASKVEEWLDEDTDTSMRMVHRSAIDGRFVTAEHAESNPDTTVTEEVETNDD